MKKNYVKPNVEIFIFEQDEILTNSGFVDAGEFNRTTIFDWTSEE